MTNKGIRVDDNITIMTDTNQAIHVKRKQDISNKELRI